MEGKAAWDFCSMIGVIGVTPIHVPMIFKGDIALSAEICVQ